MSASSTLLASDGQPPVDVVELATSIKMGGARKETMVSQREIRAMAHAIVDFNTAMCHAANAIHMVEFMGRHPTPQVRATMISSFEQLRKCLEQTGHLEKEQADDAEVQANG